MRKQVQVLFLLILVLSLTACGVSQTTMQAGSTSAQVTEQDHADVFRMNENINTYYFVKEGGVHNMTYVNQYLYNLLPVLYGGK